MLHKGHRSRLAEKQVRPYQTLQQRRDGNPSRDKNEAAGCGATRLCCGRPLWRDHAAAREPGGFDCPVQLAAKTRTPTSRPVVGVHIPGRQLTVGGHPLDANSMLVASPLTSTVKLTTTDVDVNILLRNSSRFVNAHTMAGRGRRSAQSRRYEQNRKIKKFVKGLKPSLKARLLELDPRSLEEVLGVANKQENKVESYQGENEAQKEGVPKPFRRQDRKKRKLMDGQQSTVASGSEKPECIHCGKRHGGNACCRKEGRCLRCGSKDHRLRECPNLKTKFIPRDASSTAIKEQGLAGDDLGDVTTGTRCDL
ncbi:hypothetical protein Taro_024943 [Colocasia esculenta]|uniref:CCHC-type domain-containing protein n=1 Tax=Colocasia esculenta TaxID=4460 RepID=A0A843VCS2_COLES|nr:hypothetical protein [Colocasia esculenta]